MLQSAGFTQGATQFSHEKFAHSHALTRLRFPTPSGTPVYVHCVARLHARLCLVCCWADTVAVAVHAQATEPCARLHTHVRARARTHTHTHTLFNINHGAEKLRFKQVWIMGLKRRRVIAPTRTHLGVHAWGGGYDAYGACAWTACRRAHTHQRVQTCMVCVCVLCIRYGWSMRISIVIPLYAPPVWVQWVHACDRCWSHSGSHKSLTPSSSLDRWCWACISMDLLCKFGHGKHCPQCGAAASSALPHTHTARVCMRSSVDGPVEPDVHSLLRRGHIQSCVV